MNKTAQFNDVSNSSRTRISIFWKEDFKKWEAETSRWGYQYICRIKNEKGEEIGYLKYNILKSLLTPAYGVYIDGHKIMDIRRKLSLTENYTCSNKDYHVEIDDSFETWRVFYQEREIIKICSVDHHNGNPDYQICTYDTYQVLSVCFCLVMNMSFKILYYASKH